MSISASVISVGMSKKFSGARSLQVHFPSWVQGGAALGGVHVRGEVQGQATAAAGPCAKRDAHHSGAYLLWMMIEGLSNEMLLAE